MKKIKRLILKTTGQAMTEYILAVIFITLITIPAIKLIPRAFGLAFNKIITFYSLRMDELASKISGLF